MALCSHKHVAHAMKWEPGKTAIFRRIFGVSLFRILNSPAMSRKPLILEFGKKILERNGMNTCNGS